MPDLRPFSVIVTVVLAAVFAGSLTHLLRPLLVRYALARPNARSSHRIPTPQGAGAAVILTTLLVAGIAIGITLSATAEPWVLFGATLAVAAIGAPDDLRPISVTPRLVLQALCVGIVIFSAPSNLRIAPETPIFLERTILLVAGLWFVNLVNFMDGLDWITVAEVIPITAALALIGLFSALSPASALVAAALGGAMIGFAPFNRPVAKVFLGDVGSLPIGLLLASCFLEMAGRNNLAAAILLPLYYLADATVTLLRRLSKREAVWQAHRSHFYQRATDNGFAVIEVVRTVFFLNLGLAVLAGLTVYLRSALADVILIAIAGGSVAMVLRSFATPRHSKL